MFQSKDSLLGGRYGEHRTVSGANSHPEHRSRGSCTGAPLASFAHFGSIGDGSEGAVGMEQGSMALWYDAFVLFFGRLPIRLGL